MNRLSVSLTGSGASAGIEPGDRIPLSVTGEPDCFRLPALVDALGIPIETIEDADGNQLEVDVAPERGLVILPGAGEAIGRRWPSLWLEHVSPGRFRLVMAPTPAPDGAEQLVSDQGLAIEVESPDWLVFLEDTGASDLASFQLGLRASHLATHGGFDRLICLPMVREMEILEHQVRTAKTVLRRFRGRAMLCDEVGLGKTIEAGIIASELVTRGLVRSLLIITPPSLVEQWQGEMRRKFSLDFTAHDDRAFRSAGAEAWRRFDRIIVSLHTAKREPHRSRIRSREWDMIIVDEAHHLRNRKTQAWRFVSELKKQYVLLLTATPVQNNLEELFNLVTLLEPGLLSTARKFQSRFVDRKDKLTPKNVDELHELLSEAMVRNRRSTVGLSFTRRWARTERVSLTPAEQSLYRDVAHLVRQRLRRARGEDGLNRMVLITLQLALGSSHRAAASMLRNLSERPRCDAQLAAELARLTERAEAIRESAKAERLLQLLDERPEKMVIFTHFRATQQMLAEVLEQAGRRAVIFHGALSRLKKEEAIRQFRGPADLLLATDAGSEGRNLQFAHSVCNFDLPWNPMRIEQRIGRLSRIGQTHDVYVFNLVAAETVEAAVLHLLEAKLSMFELVIGEIDMVLGNLDDERDFDEVVADLWADSSDVDHFARRMEELGDRLVEAKKAYFRQRLHDDKLFGNRFAPDA